ncbi:MAG: 4-amino-4-deoxychorismate lyase [Actinobacteria bacterium]|nr:4-amino-4-deoxychorismate lyase [Actinomycetota bacterium]
MRYWVSQAGGLVDAEHARVSVLDHGFTVADGVFETLKVTDGVPFAITRHLNRLERSAEAMGLPAPDRARVLLAVRETLDANAPLLGDFARLRITYTAGDAPLGSDRGEAGPTLVVAASAMKPWPESAAVITVPWPRNERSPLAGVKSTSYAENVLALARAHEHGAGEALVPDTQGRLCEGTGSNVFIVVEGRLITPTLATGCLPGVTRDLVLEWADAVEEDVPFSAIGDADEVFITSSTRDVQPVHRVDARSLAAPGPVTAAVQGEFARRSRADVDP